MTIELRLTEVDPPAEEPHRTIYHDIASLPDPVIQSLTIRYFNHDDVGLYFKITGIGTGYTFIPVSLGLLATGTNTYKTLNNFFSRAKPTVAQLPNGTMGENITLTLTAYTDAGYTNLKWTYDRVVQVIWINSADAAFTLDFLDNFDDGTVDGWAATLVYGGYSTYGHCTVAVATDYVLTNPYSLKMELYCAGYASVIMLNANGYIHKSFTTPNKTQVYAVFDLRSAVSAYAILTWGAIDKDTTRLMYIKTVPPDKWVRQVIPLPANTTIEIRVYQAHDQTQQSVNTYSWMWLDDFKIISK
jgi:hypothetical protein